MGHFMRIFKRECYFSNIRLSARLLTLDNICGLVVSLPMSSLMIIKYSKHFKYNTVLNSRKLSAISTEKML